MSCEPGACVESPDPRRAGRCVKCAMPIERSARDRDFEAKALAEGAELAQRVYGAECGPFARLVGEGMDKGARNYGENAFLDRDNLPEALEEGPDAAAYILLDCQRLMGHLPEQERQQLRLATLGVVAAGINLDQMLRRYGAIRSELMGE